MAAGDLLTPRQFYVDVQEALHDLEGGTFKAALVTSALTPAVVSASRRSVNTSPGLTWCNPI